MMIIYQSEGEVFVTTLENEHKLLKEYFNPDCGRDVDDYERIEEDNVIEISRGSLMVSNW